MGRDEDDEVVASVMDFLYDWASPHLKLEATRVTNFEAFAPDLRLLRRLLVKYGRAGQAEIIDRIITLGAEGDRAGFVEALQGGEIWGSSGSVVDTAGLTHDPPRTPEAERDSVEFRRALLRIADEMENQSIASEGSRFVGRVFKRGLQGDGT
jgi:hypothetical protein